MKVILVNGSPHPHGCTFTALEEVAAELQRQGIETEHFWTGNKPIMGCLGCNQCLETKRCNNNQDTVNRFLEKAASTDGFIFGTPIHYAGPSGFIKSFMDRVFYGKSDLFANKPAATIVSCRRGGALGGFEDLNRYYTISNMPVVSSKYWNQVHGTTPEEVRQDLEGLQIMRQLARNMAWILRSIEAGRQAGIPLPEMEAPVKTNFIR